MNDEARNPNTPRRILAVLPITCGEEWGYWYRDAGLIVRTLREMGHDARLVLLRHATLVHRNKEEPVITATMGELEDPAWWKAQGPDAVILNLWGASRFENIRSAARQATPRLVEKLDTAGIYSARIWFWRYLYEGYWQARDEGVSPPAAAVKYFFRTCLMAIMPGLLDRKRVDCLARMPVLAAESPVAVERTKEYLRAFGDRETRVVCIPHPVDETDLGKVPAGAKENKIVSVGRWGTWQKNFPLLLDVLGRFLAAHPGWSADVIGKLPADATARLGRLPGDAAARINLAGPVPHDRLARHYHAAKIFLMSSRHESFNIAAAEALCCGCGVVAQPAIASAHFFAGRKSGTVSSRYSAGSLLDALGAEAEKWERGERDAAAIAAEWTGIVGSAAVTRGILEALQ